MTHGVVLALLLASSAVASADVRIGDSEEEVRRVLGAPVASIRTESRHILAFDRGQVELRDGRVIALDLVTEEEALAIRARRIERERWERAQSERQRRERLAEGTALLERRRADPVFQTSAAAEQVAYWRAFQLSYPEVNIALEYAAALARAESEKQQQLRIAEQDQRVRDLEDRVAAAERQAARRTFLRYDPSAYVITCAPSRPYTPCADRVTTCGRPTLSVPLRVSLSGENQPIRPALYFINGAAVANGADLCRTYVSARF